MRKIVAVTRDLERRPLRADELSSFDGALFDPPRAGAEAQAREFAASALPLVVAVSCNAATFARDARLMIEGGFRLETVAPLDQFRFSPHVEIAAVFRRPRAKPRATEASRLNSGRDAALRRARKESSARVTC